MSIVDRFTYECMETPKLVQKMQETKAKIGSTKRLIKIFSDGKDKALHSAFGEEHRQAKKLYKELKLIIQSRQMKMF